MSRRLAFAALALLIVTASVRAEGLTGQYIEARTCDIWTGPCFANSEMNLTGKNAVMGWKIDKGRPCSELIERTAGKSDSSGWCCSWRPSS